MESPSLSTSSNFVSPFPPQWRQPTNDVLEYIKSAPLGGSQFPAPYFAKEVEEDDTKCWEIRLQSVSAKEGPAAGWEEND